MSHLPPGIQLTPEYITEDSSPPLRRICIAFIVLETVTIIAYFASRWIKQPSGIRIMPFLVVGGYTFCISIAILSLLICEICGGGHHIVVIPMPILIRRFKIDKALEWMYVPAVTCPKVAILLLYLKLFAQHRRWLRYACYATGTVIMLLLVYGLSSPAFSCRPFAYNWDKSIPGGTCFNILLSYRWVSFPNIVTDLVLMGLCMPAIYKIQLPLVTKISLFATFALGSVGIITSIIRFVEFFRNDIFADHTYNGTNALIWTIVETGVYFMTASLLTMRPLFRWIFGHVTVPEYLQKLTSSWTSKGSGRGTSEGSTKRSKGSMAVRKEETFELHSSSAARSVRTPEPAIHNANRNGFLKLDERSTENILQS